MSDAVMSAGILSGRYDWRLVALSIVIAIGASYVALDLAGRVSTARGRARRLWLIGGASSMGLGIWAMHYIGMLAYRLPVPIAYDVPLVVASLVAAFAASAVALYVVSRKRLSPAYLIGGSLAMGSGIVAMHYIGMSAMRLAAHRTYSAGIVALSIAIGVVVSGVALHLAFRLRNSEKNSAWSRPFAALVMGFAIASMHYTGMAAICFHHAEAVGAGTNLVSVSALGVFCIATVTFAVLGSSLLLGVLASRKTSQRQREVTERWGLLLGVSQDGLFDVNLVTGTVYLSPRWMTMLGYGADELPQAWATWEGLLPPEEREAVVDKVEEYLARGQGMLEVEFRLRHRNGGWIWVLSRMHAAWTQQANRCG